MDTHQSRMLRHAAFTLAAALLAFSAFDDITTDHDTSFVFERAAAAGCCLWFMLVSWRFIQQGRRTLGSTSLCVAVALMLALLALRRGPGSSVPVEYVIEYFTALIGLVWFVAISVLIALQARRPRTITV